MRMFTRISLILAAAFAGLGILLGIAGLILGFSFGDFKRMANEGYFSIGPDSHWNGTNSGVGDEKQMVTYSADQVDTLDVSFGYGQVYVSPSAQAGQIAVQIAKPEGVNDSICQLDGKTLKIDNKQSAWGWNWFSFGGHENNSWVLNLYLPADQYFKLVNMKVGAGQIDLATELKAGSVTIDIGAGTLETTAAGRIDAERMSLNIGAGSGSLGQVKVSDLKLKVGAGEAAIAALEAGNAKVDCGLGQTDLGLVGQENNYNYTVQVGLGEVAVGNQNFTGLAQSKNINNGADKYIDIQCGLGQVDLSFTQSNLQ